MAFITNQWINRGQGVRSRSHSPVSVNLEVVEPDDSWSKKTAVAVEIRARLDSGEYQVLSIQEGEMEMVLHVAVSAASDEVKRRVATLALATLPDEVLVSCLKRVFATRS